MYKGCDNCIHITKNDCEEPCDACIRNGGNSDNWASGDPLVEKRHAFDELCDKYSCADDCPIFKSGWHICEDKNTETFTEEELDKGIEIFSVTENDPINPKHYTDGNIEVIDFIDDKKLGFCLGNVVKYVARAGKKNPDKEIEDLEKAEWYLKHHIEKLKEAK